MLILGIETSCDETAAAVIRDMKGSPSVLSNVVSSQIKLHAKWGGVVPNLAAREHLKNILPVIDEAIQKASVSPEDIDLIAVTRGPGLIPALFIGTQEAKTLSYLWEKPLIGVHHIEGHIYANFISDKVRASIKSQISNLKQFQNSKPENPEQKANEAKKLTKLKSPIEFPTLCLVVSGGHTQLVLMKDHLKYEVVGTTLDDAAGEAFDKVARILNLGYPGGPEIARVATRDTRHSTFDAKFPRPMIDSGDFNFSFSGLKTAVLYFTKKNESLLKNKEFVAGTAAEFQQAVIDVLSQKTIAAAQKYKVKTVMLAGGVSANEELRRQLGEKIKIRLPDTAYILPPISYSLDNAAMIAAAGYFRWVKMTQKNKDDLKNNWKTLEADASLELG